MRTQFYNQLGERLWILSSVSKASVADWRSHMLKWSIPVPADRILLTVSAEHTETAAARIESIFTDGMKVITSDYTEKAVPRQSSKLKPVKGSMKRRTEPFVSLRPDYPLSGELPPLEDRIPVAISFAEAHGYPSCSTAHVSHDWVIDKEAHTAACCLCGRAVRFHDAENGELTLYIVYL